MKKKCGKLRSIYNLYNNKQDEIKKTTQFRVEEVFGNIIPKHSPEEITKLKNSLAKIK